MAAVVAGRKVNLREAADPAGACAGHGRYDPKPFDPHVQTPLMGSDSNG